MKPLGFHPFVNLNGVLSPSFFIRKDLMILREIATFSFIYLLLFSVAAAAAPVQHQMEPIDPNELQQERIVDYLETGIPNCALCHASEQRPATDYRNDLECRQCHSADYSQQFLDIDERYKVPLEDRQYKVALAKPTSTPSSAIKTVKKTIILDGMVLIPAGEFIMGTNDWWPKSGPEHSRHLSDFYMDKYEVTNAKYEKFIAATSHRLPDHWVKNGNKIPADQEEFPITFVSWQDAVDYCEWEGKRLPSEFEWEKAARGTDGRVFPWGDEFDKDKGNTPQYGHGKSMEVGSFENGMSPYGLYDMAGNVFEWTSSWYKSYPGNTHNDPNEGETYRVVKGGSWYDCTYYRCGISAPAYNRIFFHPMTKNFTFGFRCAQDP